MNTGKKWNNKPNLILPTNKFIATFLTKHSLGWRPFPSRFSFVHLDTVLHLFISNFILSVRWNYKNYIHMMETTFANDCFSSLFLRIHIHVCVCSHIHFHTEENKKKKRFIFTTWHHISSLNGLKLHKDNIKCGSFIIIIDFRLYGKRTNLPCIVALVFYQSA